MVDGVTVISMWKMNNKRPPLTPPGGGEYLLNDYKDGSPFPLRGRAGDGVITKTDINKLLI